MKKHHILVSLFSILVLGISIIFINATFENKGKTEPENHTKCKVIPKDVPSHISITTKTEKVVKNIQVSKDTIELGKVAWLRDYDKAVQLSKENNKPIFILFQEVPGCLNCQRFGREVMSNPLVVDIIEHHFVPLCIFNNQGGKDAKILDRFGEPSWNNPVVRIVDTQGKDITKRMGSFHPKEIIPGISQALTASQQAIPTYFDLLQTQVEAKYGKTEKATFPMYCFWAGELKLGQVEGVINTTPGFMNGREVVEITFDANKTSYDKIVQSAKDLRAVDGAFVANEKQKKVAKDIFGKSDNVSNFRVDKEPKYYMSNTVYKHIPMLSTQRIQVNKAIYNRQNPQKYLSPSQIKLYHKIEAKNIKLPDYSLSQNIVDDWEDLETKITQK